MLSFRYTFQKYILGAQSPTLYGRGKLHLYSSHHRFAARTCQITKSQAFETKYYDHPAFTCRPTHWCTNRLL